MTKEYEMMVNYTALFIQKYCAKIQSVIPDSKMSYGYHSDFTSEVCFEFANGSYYKFDIKPKHNIVNIFFDDNEKATFTLAEYKKMLSVISFVKIDYSKVYEIFDFIEKTDVHYHSIKTTQRFNQTSFFSDDCKLTLNNLAVAYVLKYKDIYKKIHNKAKLQTTTSLKLCFDENMNIDVRYFIELSFVSGRSLHIYFDANKNFYMCNSVQMTIDELFKAITNEREHVIKRDIIKTLKKMNLELDIDFNNNYQEQIKILEMALI